MRILCFIIPDTFTEWIIKYIIYFLIIIHIHYDIPRIFLRNIHTTKHLSSFKKTTPDTFIDIINNYLTLLWSQCIIVRFNKIFQYDDSSSDGKGVSVISEYVTSSFQYDVYNLFHMILNSSSFKFLNKHLLSSK